MRSVMQVRVASAQTLFVTGVESWDPEATGWRDRR